MHNIDVPGIDVYIQILILTLCLIFSFLIVFFFVKETLKKYDTALFDYLKTKFFTIYHKKIHLSEIFNYTKNFLFVLSLIFFVLTTKSILSCCDFTNKQVYFSLILNIAIPYLSSVAITGYLCVSIFTREFVYLYEIVIILLLAVGNLVLAIFAIELCRMYIGAKKQHFVLAGTFAAMIPSPAEFSDFISLFDVCLFNLVAINIFVSVLSILVVVSYYKREFLLRKDFVAQFKNNLQNIQVEQAANELRLYLIKLVIFFNFGSTGLLLALWYTFKLTIKHFNL